MPITIALMGEWKGRGQGLWGCGKCRIEGNGHRMHLLLQKTARI